MRPEKLYLMDVAATQDAPKLRAQVEAILADELVEQDGAAEND